MNPELNERLFEHKNKTKTKQTGEFALSGVVLSVFFLFVIAIVIRIVF